MVLICSRAATAFMSCGYISVCVCTHMHSSAQCVIIISLVSLLKISLNGRKSSVISPHLISLSLWLSLSLCYQSYIVVQLSDLLFSEYIFFAPVEKNWVTEALWFKKCILNLICWVLDFFCADCLKHICWIWFFFPFLRSALNWK